MLLKEGVKVKKIFLVFLFLMGLVLILCGINQIIDNTKKSNIPETITIEPSSEMPDLSPRADQNDLLNYASNYLINQGIDITFLTNEEILELWEKMSNNRVEFIYPQE